MGLFDRFYYGKAGKRDYTEMDMPKNRVSLFFLVLKDRFFDIIKVNLLQLISWIPFLVWTYLNLLAVLGMDTQALLDMENGSQQLLQALGGYLMVWLIGLIPCVLITGPSSAGAAYVTRNWARDQHAFLFSDFKDAFKSNWKQALAVSAISALVPLLSYTAVTYYGTMAASNLVLMLPLVVVLSATMIWALMLPLLYPLMIGYELKFSMLLRNALIMAVAGLPRMLLARLITLIPVALLLLGLYIGNGALLLGVSMYYMLFGFAFSRLVYASVANGLFDKYLHPHIEGAPIGMGLRPHTEEDDWADEDDDEDDEDEEADGEEDEG